MKLKDTCSLEGKLCSSSNVYIGEGNGTPHQYSCLENPTGGAHWQAIVHGVTKSRTRLSDFTLTFKERWLGEVKERWLGEVKEPWLGPPLSYKKDRARCEAGGRDKDFVFMFLALVSFYFECHTLVFFLHFLWEKKVKVKVKSLSRVRLFVTPWTVAYQAPWSMGFCRQEY